MPTAEPPVPSRSRRPRWMPFAIGAVVVLVAAVLAAALLRGGDAPAPAGTRGSGAAVAQAAPVAVTPERLAQLARTQKRAIYWAGRSNGGTYELTQTEAGEVYVRYLDAGAAIGDPRPNFLTVGTYPQREPYEAVRKAARRDGAQVERLDDDGLAVANRSRPNSWYLAYPDSAELVEVFSPRPGRARELVRTGRVVALEG